MQKIKKIHIVLIILISLIMFFSTGIEINDELWTFQNVVKLCNGYTLYGDCNIIQTPLFFIIGKMIVGTIGINFFVYRIFGGIISSIIIILIYKILKKIELKSLLYFLLMIIILQPMFNGGASYNMLAIIFMFIGIILQFEFRHKHRMLNNIIQGILVAFTFFSKQNIGIYFIIGNCLIEIYYNRKNIASLLKNLIMQLSTMGIIVLIFLIGLYMNNMLDGFISYAVLGLKEFSQENISVALIPCDVSPGIGIELAIIVASVLISVVAIRKNKIQNKEKNIVITLLCFGIPMLLIAYPIVNTYHLRLGAILMYILFFYLIDYILVKDILNEKLVAGTNKMTIILIVIYAIYAIVRSILYINEYDFSKSWDNPYFGAVLVDGLEEEMQEVIEYIIKTERTGTKVITFSDRTALYNVILKRSNGAMDLPMLGNFGKDGQDGMIKIISKLENTQILINKESGVQESEKIIEWIKSNLKQVGEIQGFLIYSSN